MKQVYIIHENHPKLLLLFAGWAADETPFKQYLPKGMDYMICYDYRTLDFDKSIFDRYRQINVVVSLNFQPLFRASVRASFTDSARPFIAEVTTVSNWPDW